MFWLKFKLSTCVQRFEIRTGPYGPTGKTVNLSQSRFFMLKNRSMSKKQGTVRIAVQPHGFENRNQTASHGSLWIWTFQKKKKKKTQKNKRKRNTTPEKHRNTTPSPKKHRNKTPSQKKKKSTSCLPLLSPEKHNMYLCFFFFFSLQGTSRSSLSSETLLLGEASFKF